MNIWNIAPPKKAEDLTARQMEFFENMGAKEVELRRLEYDLKKSKAPSEDVKMAWVVSLSVAFVLCFLIFFGLRCVEHSREQAVEAMKSGYEKSSIEGYSSPVWRKVRPSNE